MTPWPRAFLPKTGVQNVTSTVGYTIAFRFLANAILF